jgi:hypothetical protein
MNTPDVALWNWTRALVLEEKISVFFVVDDTFNRTFTQQAGHITIVRVNDSEAEAAGYHGINTAQFPQKKVSVVGVFFFVCDSFYRFRCRLGTRRCTF